MDPISAFATIVSLIGLFRSERSGAIEADFNEFLNWLVDKNHTELKLLVEQNSRTVIGIKALLNEQYEAFTARLEMLDSTLAAYASSLSGFADIAEGLKPHVALSEQALSILQQFESSGASKFILSETMSETSLVFLDADGEIEIEDCRFLEDDLNILVQLQLLRHDFNSRGESFFHFTRAASRLVKSKESTD